MILSQPTLRTLAGRDLAGWGPAAWGVCALLYPFSLGFSLLQPLAQGFLVGLHVAAAMGLVVLIVDQMRKRAEAGEKRIRQLEGLLPIRASRKKIRDDQGNGIQWKNTFKITRRPNSVTGSVRNARRNCIRICFPIDLERGRGERRRSRLVFAVA